MSFMIPVRISSANLPRTTSRLESVLPSSMTTISNGLYDWPRADSMALHTYPARFQTGMMTEMDGLPPSFARRDSATFLTSGGRTPETSPPCFRNASSNEFRGFQSFDRSGPPASAPGSAAPLKSLPGAGRNPLLAPTPAWNGNGATPLAPTSG